jgi:chromosome segregation ATPase
MQTELDRQREQLSHAGELVTEYEQLAAEREQTNKLLTETLEKQRGAQQQNDQATAETRNREISAAVQKVRDEMSAEADRMRQEWDTEFAKLADESSSGLDERNRLQEELENASKTIAQREQERDQLKQDLLKANQALGEAQANPGVGNGHLDLDAVREEAVRVEASLQAIIKAIEDPSAELSFVVRKNVERAQLDSYLQGLRFATGGK